MYEIEANAMGKVKENSNQAFLSLTFFLPVIFRPSTNTVPMSWTPLRPCASCSVRVVLFYGDSLGVVSASPSFPKHILKTGRT